LKIGLDRADSNELSEMLLARDNSLWEALEEGSPEKARLAVQKVGLSRDALKRIVHLLTTPQEGPKGKLDSGLISNSELFEIAKTILQSFDDLKDDHFKAALVNNLKHIFSSAGITGFKNGEMPQEIRDSRLTESTLPSGNGEASNSSSTGQESGPISIAATPAGRGIPEQEEGLHPTGAN
jgi:hypothetical protein